jgi:2-polyprenyl-3-methyl-5-hydroxy-6-metoxy-1,4-benzoquinol methylase
VSADYGNLQKHLNPNLLQRFLLNRFKQRVMTLVQGAGVELILDAGCGEGFIIQYLKKNNNSLKIVGIDYRVPALVWATSMISDTSLAAADIHSLPFVSDSFDLVLCLEVLEHLPNPGKALDELCRVARGYCLLSVPHEPFFHIANFLRGKHWANWGNDPEHLQSWTAVAFKKFVESKINVVWLGTSFPWIIVLGRKRGRGRIAIHPC